MPLLWPTVSVHKITDIKAEQLHAMGIKALILDADDTPSGHGEQVLFPGVETWLASMKASGCAMLIASNNFKERVEPFAKKLGLPFISLSLKPLPVGLLRAVHRLGTKRSETAMVGDQLFTDILGANLIGLRSFLVTPESMEARFGFRRRLEVSIRKKIGYGVLGGKEKLNGK